LTKHLLRPLSADTPPERPVRPHLALLSYHDDAQVCC